MRRIISFAFLLLIITAASAQRGSPLLTNFVESREIENQNWAICQDENNVMLFANRKGILKFDGEEWLTIRIPVIPYSMQRNPADGKIYIGGDGNFGYLEYDDEGKYRYASLSGDTLRPGMITRIIFADSLIWFYSDQSIVRFNRKKMKPDFMLKAKEGSPFTGMLVVSGNTYVNVLEKGLHRIDSDTLFPIVTGYLTQNTNILFSLSYGKDRVLVGTGDGILSLFDGIKYFDFPVKDDGYLTDNILSEGIVLGDTAYAFSTLEGGAIVVDRRSGKVLYTVNNQSDLPDDEIFAIGSDNSGGLWLSHQYGLTRADLRLPVENYSTFPGLKGNLSSAVRYENELYVATSEGVYYLEEVKNYTDVVVLVRDTPSASPDQQEIDEEEPQEEPATRRNIFNRIFGKRPGQHEVSIGQAEGPTVKAEAIPPVSYTKRTVSKLKSIHYMYKKVEGLSEKCRQLVQTPQGILAATNKGLFIITDHKATAVVPYRYITYIRWHPYEGLFFIAAIDGCFSIRHLNGKWITEPLEPAFTGTAYSIFRDSWNSIWIGGDNSAYRADLNDDPSLRKYVSYSISREYPDRYILRIINDTVFLFTGSGIHFYNGSEDRFDPYVGIRLSVAADRNYLMPLSNYPLINQDGRWISLDEVRVAAEKELSLLKVFDEIIFLGVEKNHLWVIDGNNKLYGVNRRESTELSGSINVIIKSITNSRGTSFSIRDVKFDRGDNVINFTIVAPYYLKQDATQYQFYINKVMDNWSQWSPRTNYERTIPKAGEYILQVRARDIWGNIAERKAVRFTIRAPLTKTLLFYILVSLAGLLLLILIIRFREKQLQLKNRLLEEKVKERTAELASQKEEITASIEYAGRIQRAMLPGEDLFRESFSDYFILFKPRDIVSGDFYWIGEDDKSIFFTVADCTGHGVPGAFMSTMGISTLNEIIANNHDLQADMVLNLLKEKTMRALHQTGKVGEAADGMDVAFCVLNKNRKVLQFAGAFNPMILFQSGEFREFRADRMPIGIHYGDEKQFTNHTVQVSRGDTVYIFSDGFTDQFGGPDGAKYRMANFRNLLKEIYYRPMVEQHNLIENEFQRWRGSADQVDDITIIGVRI